MDTAFVAIGDPSLIQPVLKGTISAHKYDVFVFTADSVLSPAILSALNELGINVLTYSQYLKVISSTLHYTPLSSFAGASAYAWMKTGREYFGVLHSNQFDLSIASKKELPAVAHMESIDDAVIGNTGAFFAFVKRDTVTIHSGNSLDLVLSLHSSSSRPIKAIIFDLRDEHIAMCTNDRTEVYNISRGSLLCSCLGNDVLFYRDGVSVSGEFWSFNVSGSGEDSSEDRTKRRAGNIRKISDDGNRTVEFVDGNPQRIIYKEGDKTYAKSQANIYRVEFTFSESRLYAFMTKKIGDKIQSSVESFSGESITSTQLPKEPVSFAVSDTDFVVLTNAEELMFFRRDKYGYKLLKSIKKEGGGIVSMMGEITCFYDLSSRNIEFYDFGKLRSVYSLSDCTGISWSRSGLYVAAYACYGTSSGLLYIFNVNGELISKRTLNHFARFQWRPFVKATKGEIESLQKIEYEEQEDESEGIDNDAASLLSRWKAYLISTMELSK